MEVIADAAACAVPGRGTALTIGAFDGVHRGHRFLLDEVLSRASARGVEPAVITFDRHPATVVRPSSAPKLLTDLDQKLELLEAAGIVYALVVTFDEERAREPPEDFVAELVWGCLRARSVVVGRDFHFGHKRRGNVALLEQMGEKLGFDVVGLDLLSEGGGAVSSTRIREMLSEGMVEDAAELLGRYHEVRGVVVRGDARGGPVLGFPTANVRVPPDILLPGEGIYAGYFEGAGRTRHPAALYVGARPTFYEAPGQPQLEAYLLDFSGDIYGDDARVSFVARLREDRRFESVEALAEQMARDADAARTVLAR
jgi:riboflavin kinase/FMN adenylyltransferase